MVLRWWLHLFLLVPGANYRERASDEGAISSPHAGIPGLEGPTIWIQEGLNLRARYKGPDRQYPDQKSLSTPDSPLRTGAREKQSNNAKPAAILVLGISVGALLFATLPSTPHFLSGRLEVCSSLKGCKVKLCRTKVKVSLFLLLTRFWLALSGLLLTPIPARTVSGSHDPREKEVETG